MHLFWAHEYANSPSDYNTLGHLIVLYADQKQSNLIGITVEQAEWIDLGQLHRTKH